MDISDVIRNVQETGSFILTVFFSNGFEQQTPFEDRHEAKSAGGRQFRQDNVSQVTVEDPESGKIYLNLVKGNRALTIDAR